MDRMACVNLPAFPLQLLVQRHPDWQNHPVVVVDKDKPQGVILWINKLARRSSILPGMRYAKGLSLAPDLRAGEVSGSEIQEHIDRLTERLRFFTPDVEPSHYMPGVFWLNASGLSLLYPSIKKWAGLIVSELTGAGFQCSMAVGFSRYGSYAIARTSRRIEVFDNRNHERQHARALSIVRLGFPPDLRDALAQLAITTLGGFIDLPEDGVRKRFGNEAYDLYKMARDELFSHLDAVIPDEPFLEITTLDHPESHIERLMFVIEKMIAAILVSMRKRSRLLAAVSILLVLDNGDKRNELLRPAEPTLEVTQILRLIELRLQAISLVSGVVDISVRAEAVLATQKQLELFAKRPRRDLRAAERAFAQLRAEFGDRAVMRARLRDGHLPEACYEWEPMDKLSAPTPRKVKAHNLVRRIFARSVALLSWARRQGDGRLPSIGEMRRSDTPTFHPRIDSCDTVGPYIVSGGWWRRRVHREYYFVRNPQGRWLWIYYDKRRKKAFVQGAIE
jgi:protein ImuB